MKKLFFFEFLLIIISVGLIGCEDDTQPDFLENWTAEQVITDADVRVAGIDNCFYSEEISDVVFARMWLKSWKENCTLQRSDLRYIKVLHRNANGQTQLGEMVVNTAIADDVVQIFRRLYDNEYRIERMVLVDNYNADDDTSMINNNSSSFNFRFITGSQTQISNHGLGLAIDINPLYNPYVKQREDGSYYIAPDNGSPYAFDRDTRNDIPYKIDHDDLAYKFFTEAGFEWGGDWTTLKDYQHFEKEIQTEDIAME